MNERAATGDAIPYLQSFFERYGDDSTVQVFGGLAVAALLDPRSRVFRSARTVVVSPEFQFATRRPNGSKRDIDLLALTTDPEMVTVVKTNLEAALDDQLASSVFSFHTEAEWQANRQHPYRLFDANRFTSERFAVEDPLREPLLWKGLYPFSAIIDNASLEPWYIEGRDFHVAMPHPAVQLGNYIGRSISGVRHKDEPKLQQLVARLDATDPSILGYLMSGPAQSQLDLARIMHSAGVGVDPLNQVLGAERAQPPMTPAEIRDSDLFDQELSSRHREQVLGLYALKANSLQFGERFDFVRTLWQRHVEPRIGRRMLSEA